MTPPVDRHQFWRRTLPGWDAGFAVLLVLSALSMLSSSQAREPVAVGVLLGTLAVAYLGLARRGALRGNRRLTSAYVGVLIVVVSLCTALNSGGTVLLFLGFAQLWYFSRGLRSGTVGSLLLTLGVAGGELWRVRPEGIELAQLAGQYLVALGFSIALGFWLTRMNEQNEVLAELIAEVERTQAESAVAQHKAGVLAERERVAQRVHDTLAQGFTGIVLLAQGGQARLSAGDAAGGAAAARELERVARAHLAEARALVAAFGSATLDDGGLTDTVDRLVQRFHAETGLTVRIEGPSSPVGRDTEVVLLRGVQEALVAAREGGPTRLVLGVDGVVRTPASS
ncbi:histidine kinase [Cellulomonas sp. NPDC089187]|uniref:sensor histidine kinase n=1 Tax=Cellulomonas sp. NPDC089187 TaxID=3154970 RepID=UPI00341EE4BF